MVTATFPYIPAFKIIPGITFKKAAAGKWTDAYITLQAQVYGKQNKVAQFEQVTNGYFLADIYIGTTTPLGKKQRWNLVAFCNNLFNKGYFNHLSLVKTIGIREPGRNIGAQLRYSF